MSIERLKGLVAKPYLLHKEGEEALRYIPKLLAVVEAGNLLELRSKRIVELLKALGHEGEALRLEKARSAYSNAAAEL